MTNNFILPTPIINQKEADTLDILSEKYRKLIEPNKIVQLGAKAGQLVPERFKKLGTDISLTISEYELYTRMMKVAENGFKTLEEQAAKFSINEKQILNKINHQSSKHDIISLDEICLMRSYDLAKLVNTYKSQDIATAAIEGGGTGALGFWGLPFNFVLSTFLYFRAVQSIAMFYGYDVKNDSTELVIASEVFTSALSPIKNDINNEATNIIGKIMLMSHAAVIQQTAKKTWTDMAARGGIPLLLTQMRALANKAAQKALQNAGAKELESRLFKEAFEQIGRKLTLKTIGKAVPVVSAVISALIDTAQMRQILEYADIFYKKRFILEKENRIYTLLKEYDITITDTDITNNIAMDVEFATKNFDA